MPATVNSKTTDPQALLSHAAGLWERGRIAVLPTESLYEGVAGALHPEAVRSLVDLASPGESPAIVLAGAAEALDWLPFLPPAARRFIGKVGPGRWRLQAGAGIDFGLLERLPAPVRELLAPDANLTLHWPDQPLWSQALRELKEPLVSLPLHPAATSAEEARERLGAADTLVIDGGTTSGVLPTILRTVGRRLEIVREGGLSAHDVKQGQACRILFVCTGNTCRSPMAQVLCERLLADALGCQPAELPEWGFVVQSAGLAAMMGEVATPEAVSTAQALGADLSQHRSRRITYGLFAQADFVFGMTGHHVDALQTALPDGGGAVGLLAPAGEDLADPIGGERAVYERCAQDILRYLQHRLPEFLHAL